MLIIVWPLANRGRELSVVSERVRGEAHKKILATPAPVNRANNHRDPGRQGARDKERGRNPLKQDQ